MSVLAAAAWLKWAVVGAFSATLVFALGLTRLMPWWRELATRSLIVLDFCWAATLAPLTGAELFHWTESGVIWTCYYAASMTVSGMVTLWRLWAIWMTQRRGRRLEAQRAAAQDEQRQE